MQSEQSHVKSIIKYAVIGASVAGFFYYVPSQKQTLKDTIIYTIIITMTIYIIMNNFNSSEHFDITPNITTDTPPDVIMTPTSSQPLIPESTTPQMPTKSQKQMIKPLAPQFQPKQPTVEEQKTTKETTGSRMEHDVINDDLPYTDYNHLPMAASYKPTDFEYGDSFLPPEKWYPDPPFPPVCVAEKRCPVCPVYTTGTPVDVKEWNQSRKILPPDGINTDYIKDKLNSGR